MISVVICTYNRAAALREVLSDLSQLDPVPSHEIECIVIDNNSADDTADVVRDVSAGFPFHLERFLETEQGLSHARNRGIREARGEWIVFADDDDRIGPHWLRNLITDLEANGAQAGGGPVIAIWPAVVPRWVAVDGPYVMKGVFPQLDLSEQSFDLTPKDPELFGGNMAFRAGVFRKYGVFDTSFGRKGSRLTVGEDSEIFSRLSKQGVPLRYVANAEVRHPVTANRLKLGYVLRWKFWAGYSGDPEIEEFSGPRIGTVPRYIFKQIIANVCSYASSVIRLRPQAAVYFLGNLFFDTGVILGSVFKQRQNGADRRITPSDAPNPRSVGSNPPIDLSQ